MRRRQGFSCQSGLKFANAANFRVGALQQQIYKIDEVLLRVGLTLGGLLLFAFIALKPWQAQTVTGDFLIALPGANGTVMEIREQVVLNNGNVPVAIRQLEERYPEALTVMPVLSWDLGLDTAVLTLAAGGVIVILLTGWRLRREERRTLTIWKTLERHGRVELREFVANSDFTKRQVITAIRLINNRGLGYFAIDRSTGFIEDRNKQHRLTHIESCEACGAKVALEIALPVIEAPRCPYCQAGLTLPEHALRPAPQAAEPVGALQPQTLLARPANDGDAPDRRQSRGAPMSIPLFIILVIFCWPAAVGYAVYKFKSA